MKTLITGANGFTGSHLVRKLLSQGHSVTGYVRKTSDLSRLKDSNIPLIFGDITDSQTLTKALQGIDTIFHTAAYVELGIVNATEMQRTNVEGTRAVLEAAKTADVKKIIYCSTIGIFGDTRSQVINETYQRQQTDFSSAYDSTKYYAQKLVDDYAKQGLPVCSILPSGIFGPDDPHFKPVLEQFLKKRLKFWAGGDRITGIVHVDDLAEAMILAAEKGRNGEHYIISDGELSTRKMFEIFSQETGIPAPIEAPEILVRILGNLLDPLGRLFSWQPPLSRERVHYIYDRCVRVDATKARQELGWNPRSAQVTLQQIIRGNPESYHVR